MIERDEITALMSSVAGVMQRFFAKASADFSSKLYAMEVKLAAIPAGPKGDAGRDGAPGADGQRGIDGKDGAPGARGEPGIKGDAGDRGEQGPPGERGEPGPMGKDGPAGAVGEQGPKGEQGPPGEQGPRGERGEQGIAGAIGEKGEQGPRGEAGADGQPGATGARGQTGDIGLNGKDGRDGRDGKDGDNGRDALELNVLSGIDESKSYPRGTFAEYRGGLIRALRATDPVEGDLDSAGWSVVLNGIYTESEETKDEGRTINRVTVYTNGRRLSRDIKTRALLYREVWREGEYEPGDVVTFGGSAFHCQQATTQKPEQSADWKLMVKRGRDGKDGDAPAAASSKPVRLK